MLKKAGAALPPPPLPGEQETAGRRTPGGSQKRNRLKKGDAAFGQVTCGVQGLLAVGSVDEYRCWLHIA